MGRNAGIAGYVEAAVDALSEGVLVLDGKMLSDAYAHAEYMADARSFLTEASRGLLSADHVPLIDAKSLPFFAVLVPVHDGDRRTDGLAAIFTRNAAIDDAPHIDMVSFYYGDDESKDALTRIAEFTEKTQLVSAIVPVRNKYVDVFASCRSDERHYETCVTEKTPLYAWTLLLCRKLLSYIHKGAEYTILNELHETGANMEWFTSALVWNSRRDCEREHRLHTMHVAVTHRANSVPVGTPSSREDALYTLCGDATAASAVAALKNECLLSPHVLVHVLERMCLRMSKKIAVVEHSSSEDQKISAWKADVTVGVSASGRMACFVKFKGGRVVYMLSDAAEDIGLKQLLDAHPANLVVTVNSSAAGLESNTRKEDLAMAMMVVWWTGMCWIPPSKALVDELVGVSGDAVSAVAIFQHKRAVEVLVHDAAVLQRTRLYAYTNTQLGNCANAGRALHVDVLPDRLPDTISKIPGVWKVLMAYGRSAVFSDPPHDKGTQNMAELLNSTCYSVNLANVLAYGGTFEGTKPGEEPMSSAEFVRWLLRDVSIKFPAVLSADVVATPHVLCARAARLKLKTWDADVKAVNKACKFFHTTKTRASKYHWLYIPKEKSIDTPAAWAKIYATKSMPELALLSKDFLAKCKKSYKSIGGEQPTQHVFSMRLLERMEKFPHQLFLNEHGADAEDAEVQEGGVNPALTRLEKLFDVYPSYEFCTKVQLFPVGFVLEERKDVTPTAVKRTPIYACFWGLESVVRVLEVLSTSDDDSVLKGLFLKDSVKHFVECMELDLVSGLLKFNISRLLPNVPVSVVLNYMNSVLKSTYDQEGSKSKDKLLAKFETEVNLDEEAPLSEKLAVYNNFWNAAELLGI